MPHSYMQYFNFDRLLGYHEGHYEQVLDRGLLGRLLGFETKAVIKTVEEYSFPRSSHLSMIPDLDRELFAGGGRRFRLLHHLSFCIGLTGEEDTHIYTLSILKRSSYGPCHRLSRRRRRPS